MPDLLCTFYAQYYGASCTMIGFYIGYGNFMGHLASLNTLFFCFTLGDIAYEMHMGNISSHKWLWSYEDVHITVISLIHAFLSNTRMGWEHLG